MGFILFFVCYFMRSNTCRITPFSVFILRKRHFQILRGLWRFKTWREWKRCQNNCRVIVIYITSNIRMLIKEMTENETCMYACMLYWYSSFNDIRRMIVEYFDVLHMISQTPDTIGWSLMWTEKWQECLFFFLSRNCQQRTIKLCFLHLTF